MASSSTSLKKVDLSNFPVDIVRRQMHEIIDALIKIKSKPAKRPKQMREESLQAFKMLQLKEQLSFLQTTYLNNNKCPDIYLLNIFMHLCSQTFGFPDEINKVFKALHKKDIADEYTYAIYIQAMTEYREPNLALEAYRCAKAANKVNSVTTSCMYNIAKRFKLVKKIETELRTEEAKVSLSVIGKFAPKKRETNTFSTPATIPTYTCNSRKI